MAKRDPRLEAQMHLPGDVRDRHSPLYRWMLENHAALARAIERDGPRWDARARVAGDHGLTDKTGRPPSVKVMQKTWYRVCAAIESRRTKPERPAVRPVAPDAPVAPTPPIPRPVPGQGPARADDDETPIFRIGGARDVNHGE